MDLTESQIETALERVAPGLEKYLWIQSRVHECNVTRNADFQRRFNGFYRIRRGEEWRQKFYALFEASKRETATFAAVLQALHDDLGRIEASFSSKLVATLDPTKPVIDRFVLENFGLRLPWPYEDDRLRKTIDIHKVLVRKYEELLASPTGRGIVAHFDRAYPRAGVSDLKKVDLVLWQHRE
jgi:hypothetical protein